MSLTRLTTLAYHTCLLLLHVLVTAGPINAQDVTRIDVITNCSQDLVLPRANSTQEMVLHVILEDNSTAVNCSWILQVEEEEGKRVGTTLIVDQQLVDDTLCSVGDLAVYDRNPDNGTAYFVGSACQEDFKTRPGFSGRPGFSSYLVLIMSSTSWRNRTLLYYSSAVWEAPLCPRNYTTIPTTPGLQIRDDVGHRGYSNYLPRGLVCSWEFSSPDGGPVTVTLSDSEQDVTGCFSFCLVRDARDTTPISIDMCLQRTGLDYMGNSGTVFMQYLDSATDAKAPVFSFSVTSQVLCDPAGVQVRASQFYKRALRGVSDPGVCWWTIVGEVHNLDDVLMLTELDNQQFLHDCGSEDVLVLVDGTATRNVSLCDNSSFPLWTVTPSLDLRLHAGQGGSRREFLLYFMVVPKVSACQGQGHALRASGGEGWVSGGRTEVQQVLADVGAECVWSFLPDAASDGTGSAEIRATVWAGQDSLDLHNCSLWSLRFQALALNNEQDHTTATVLDPAHSTVISPVCVLNNTSVTLTYTSSAPSLMLVYLVDRNLTKTLPAFSVDFRVTGSGSRVAAPGKWWGGVVVVVLVWVVVRVGSGVD